MAESHTLRGGDREVRSMPPPSAARRHRLVLVLGFAGGLSFWLPDVAAHIHAGPNIDSRHVWVITILMPATFLLAYVVARKVAARWGLKWVGPAMLIGVWLTGGLFMTIAAMASGSDFVGASGVWRLLIILFSVIPIITYILASADGSVFALLAVTLGALVFCGARATWFLLASETPSPNVTPDKSASHQQSKVA